MVHGSSWFMVVHGSCEGFVAIAEVVSFQTIAIVSRNLVWCNMVQFDRSYSTMYV